LSLIYLRFDAFRSIFPAGTVSGAPKIKAIELVYELEQDRRGVYAGAVGRFDFANDAMDTCIAIRTTVFKDGVAYLQAGGGIVHDSVEEDEYNETINKLKGNVKALEDAEREWFMIFGPVVAEYPWLGHWYDMQQSTEPSS
jgi:anthranilate synthase component I